MLPADAGPGSCCGGIPRNDGSLGSTLPAAACHPLPSAVRLYSVRNSD